MKPSLRYYHKRTALPSDRFHHAPAARHIPYHSKTRNTVSVLVKDTLHVSEQAPEVKTMQADASVKHENFDILTEHAKPEKKEKPSFKEKMAARCRGQCHCQTASLFFLGTAAASVCLYGE